MKKLVDGYDAKQALRKELKTYIHGSDYKIDFLIVDKILNSCTLSPAELAEILKGKAWVLEKLDEWLYELTAVIHDQWVRKAYSATRDKIQDLESQVPSSSVVKEAEENERKAKAEAWDKLYAGITGRDLVHLNVDLADLEERMDNLLT